MKRILLYLLTVFTMLGCDTSGRSETISDDIEIPSEYLSNSFDTDKTKQTITFTTTTDWSISLDEATKTTPKWLTISPMSGEAGDAKLSITLDENVDTESRKADVTINAGKKSTCFTISQDAFEPNLSLSKMSKVVTSDAGEFNIELTSNIDWQVTDIPSWITLSQKSGNGDQTISFTYTENNDTSRREATITFKASNYNTEEELYITQDSFDPILSLNSSRKDVESSEGSILIELTSNIDWQVSDIPDWVTLAKKYGKGNERIEIFYSENRTTSVRVATIKFEAEDYNNSTLFAISQAAFEPTLALDRKSKYLDTSADSFEVELISNLDWSASDVPEWITINPTSGNGSKTITVNYTENNTTSKRIANIKFKADDYENSSELTLTQAAFEPTLNVDTKNIEINHNAGSTNIYIYSNLKWSTSGIPSWITLNPASGDGNKSITIEYEANSTSNVREATIEFSNIEYSKSSVIILSQSASQLDDFEDGGDL